MAQLEWRGQVEQVAVTAVGDQQNNLYQQQEAVGELPVQGTLCSSIAPTTNIGKNTDRIVAKSYKLHTNISV